MPDKPFVINDRRKFTADGDLRPDAERPASPAAATVAEAPDTEPGRSTYEPGPDHVSDAHPDARPHREPIAFPASSPKSPSPEPGRSEDEPDPEEGPESRPAAQTHETLAFPTGAREDDAFSQAAEETDGQLPPLSAEQIEQAAHAYNATVERLDTALRANNLGAEPLPQMTFERLVQSLYMQALLQLGGAAEPGQAPQVDILGARQTIDMLSLIAEKAHGNLSTTEDSFIQSALFEIRMGFLEITQALARQAASRQPAGGGPLGSGSSSSKGPGIVR